MAARRRLESSNSLAGILKEGDLDLSLTNVFHRIGLPVKKTCDLQRAVLKQIIKIHFAEIRYIVRHDRLCQSVFRHTERDLPVHFLCGKAFHALVN